MFVFGCPIGSERAYERFAGPSLAGLAEPDSRLIELRDRDSIFTAYNEVLLTARREPGLEGVVLVHQDVEITDPRLLAKLRAEFADPSVWIAGAIGGRGVRGPAWWGAEQWRGRVLENPYPELGTGLRERELKTIAAADPELPADVDLLDGLLLALSPAAVGELLFDERLGPSFHCYDSDICLQARARGGRVRAIELGLVHHSAGGLSGQAPAYAASHEAVARKWEL